MKKKLAMLQVELESILGAAQAMRTLIVPSAQDEAIRGAQAGGCRLLANGGAERLLELVVHARSGTGRRRASWRNALIHAAP
jgi:hypothetical protein